MTPDQDTYLDDVVNRWNDPERARNRVTRAYRTAPNTIEVRLRNYPRLTIDTTLAGHLNRHEAWAVANTITGERWDLVGRVTQPLTPTTPATITITREAHTP